MNCGLVELKSRVALDMMRNNNIYLIVEVELFLCLWHGPLLDSSTHCFIEHIMAITVTKYSAYN